MNPVHNVAADLPIVTPTGRTTSKPVSVSFQDIRESILKSQIAKSAPAKPKAQDSETAAEQGMAVTAAASQVRTDTAADAKTNQEPLQAADALQQQISKCCDFTELTGKIADILEGFGLLKSSGTTMELTQEGRALLEGMITNILNAQNSTEPVVLTVAGNEAGMLNTAIPDDAQQTLQLLINEYVCSLENANNIAGANSTGVSMEYIQSAGTELAAQANAAISTSISNIDTNKLNNDAENAESNSNGIISAAGSGEQAELAPASSLLSKAVDADAETGEGKAKLPPEGEEGPASAAKSPEQKDPLAQLMQALAALKKGGEQAAVQPQKNAVSSDFDPAHAVTAPFSMRQPELVQNAKADLPSPVVTQTDMAENISNIVERMSFRSDESVQEFSVSLKPEHLGELVIKLTKGPEGLLAQIKAADASTRGLIQNEVTALTEQLKGKGIELKQIEVLYEAPAFTADPRQNEGRREATGNPYKTRHYRTPGIEETYGTNDPIATSALLSFDSSVEYQA